MQCNSIFPTIRLMDPKDLDLVNLIEQQTSRFNWDRELFASCLKIYDCYVIEIQKKVQGFVIIARYLKVRQAQILNIAVATQWHNYGIGSRLLKFIINLCNNDIDQIFLEVNIFNLSAIKLYQKFKFHQIGIRKNYYVTANNKEDALVFVLNL